MLALRPLKKRPPSAWGGCGARSGLRGDVRSQRQDGVARTLHAGMFHKSEELTVGGNCCHLRLPGEFSYIASFYAAD